MHQWNDKPYADEMIATEQNRKGKSIIDADMMQYATMLRRGGDRAGLRSTVKVMAEIDYDDDG